MKSFFFWIIVGTQVPLIGLTLDKQMHKESLKTLSASVYYHCLLLLKGLFRSENNVTGFRVVFASRVTVRMGMPSLKARKGGGPSLPEAALAILCPFMHP